MKLQTNEQKDNFITFPLRSFFAIKAVKAVYVHNVTRINAIQPFVT